MRRRGILRGGAHKMIENAAGCPSAAGRRIPHVPPRGALLTTPSALSVSCGIYPQRNCGSSYARRFVRERNSVFKHTVPFFAILHITTRTADAFHIGFV